MLQLKPIKNADLDIAAELLVEGFPHHDRRFWAQGLTRVSTYCCGHGVTSIGSFIMAKESPVGILLEIPSRHFLTKEPLINLSSWYVKPRYRWFAPQMLIQTIAPTGVTFTDLTPSSEAIELNTKLGFTTIDGDNLLVALPIAAITGRSAGDIIAIDDLPAGVLPDYQIEAIRFHMSLGCTALAIKTGQTYHPLVLDVIRRRGLPLARVLFAEKSSVVIDALKPLASLLLRRGVPLLRFFVPAGSDSGYPFALRTRHRYQVKGPWREIAINELFSERVFLRV